jgi:hypothetical protein
VRQQRSAGDSGFCQSQARVRTYVRGFTYYAGVWERDPISQLPGLVMRMASSGSGSGGGDDGDGRDDNEQEERGAEVDQTKSGGSRTVDDAPRSPDNVVPFPMDQLAQAGHVAEPGPKSEPEPSSQPAEAAHVHVTEVIETTDQRVFRITESDLLRYAQAFQEGVSRKYRPRGALWNAIALLGIAISFGTALLTTTFKDDRVHTAFIAGFSVFLAFAVQQLYVAVTAQLGRKDSDDTVPETPEKFRDLIESKGDTYRIDRNGRMTLVRKRGSPPTK